jgi:hypothetical protein
MRFRSPLRRELLYPVIAVVAAILVGAGALLVTGGDGDGDETSLRRDFRPPEPYTVDALLARGDYRCVPADERCARTYLARVANRYGPRAALTVLDRLKAEARVAPSVDDHQLAHAVGRETAERFGANVRSFQLCPNSFNYGCPHGFFEFVLGRTANPKGAAALICESARGASETTRFSCYHGVGHGVMMASAYDLHRALGACNTLRRGPGTTGCWQGVFMENVNAAVRDEARKGVFSRDEPLAPCDRVERRYRQQCFLNHAGWLVKLAENRLGPASRFCLSAPSPHVGTCMQSLGLMVTNPVWQTTLADRRGQFHETAWHLCAQFPERGRRDCVVAGIDNLGNFDRLNLRRSRAFCDAVPAELRQACYRQVGVNVRRHTSAQPVVERTCGALDARATRWCLDGAGFGA